MVRAVGDSERSMFALLTVCAALGGCEPGELSSLSPPAPEDAAPGRSEPSGPLDPLFARDPSLDVFGIRQLRPSRDGGATWSSAHWSRARYEIVRAGDARDPLGLSGLRGRGKLSVEQGELRMQGAEPRLYLYPTPRDPWRNVEVTLYYQRVADDGTGYAGVVIGVRADPEGHGSAPCQAHTYYARLRNDGATDFAKELMHPSSQSAARVDPAGAFSEGGLPFGAWIGFKLIVVNQPDGGVLLESYVDLTEGEGGGRWQRVDRMVDDGGWEVPSTCAEHGAEGGRSRQIITAGGAVLIRNTGVDEARYRWLSVREIAGPEL